MVTAMCITEDTQSLVQQLSQYQRNLELQLNQLQRDRDKSNKALSRYKNLFDCTPVAYFVLNTQGRILEVNAMGAHQLGEEKETLINRPLTDFIVKRDQKVFKRFCNQVCGQQVLQSCEIDMLKRNNLLFRAQLEGINTLDKEPDSAQGIIISDITERKRIEASRDMFFSVASHEIRTPLTNISLSLELIARGEAGPVSEGVKDMIDIARHGAMRLTRLVNEILVIQRLNAGKIVIYQEPLDVLPLVEEAIESNTAYAAQYDVHFVLKASVTEAKVNADSDRLMQVLNNLLSNAAKFSPRNDKVEILVSSFDGRVRVAVSDHGPGIPEHFREQVFDAFTQARPALDEERHKESAGLGLVISKAIIEKLNGKIGFESKPEVVTTFYFELPECRD